MNGATAPHEFLLARTYRVEGDMTQARMHLERAWKLNFPVEKLEREQMLALAQSGQFGQAEAALSPMLLDPRGEMNDICEAYVIGYIRIYRLKQAERLLAAWLADSPKQPRALKLRAALQIESFNWTGAEKDLRQVLEAIPDHAEAADLLAGVLLKLKQPEAALQVLPIAIRDPQKRQSALLRQIECLRIQGHQDQALKSAKELLVEYPDSIEGNLAVGSLESDAGHFSAAIEALEHARRLAPKSADVRYALAIALRGAGRDAEAAEHFEYVTRAREALTDVMDLRSKLQGKPTDAQVRYEIGSTMLDYGQTEHGLVWLQSALEVNPRLQPAHQRLAEYFEERASESEDYARMAQQHRKLAQQK